MRINITSSCINCGRTKSFDTIGIYCGHATLGGVYDEFRLKYTAVCSCGQDISSVYELCDTGNTVADSVISRLFNRAGAA